MKRGLWNDFSKARPTENDRYRCDCLNGAAEIVTRTLYWRDGAFYTGDSQRVAVRMLVIRWRNAPGLNRKELRDLANASIDFHLRSVTAITRPRKMYNEVMK